MDNYDEIIEIFYLLRSEEVVGIYTNRERAENALGQKSGTISAHATYYSALNYLKRHLPMDDQMKFNIWEKGMRFDLSYQKGYKRTNLPKAQF